MRGSIRRRGNSFSVTVSAGFDPVSGKRVRLQRSAPTLAAAERERTALLRQVDTGSFADPSALTVGQYIVDQYLPFADSRVRPRTAAIPLPADRPRPADDGLG